MTASNRRNFEQAVRGAPGDALGYGAGAGEEFLLHEGIGSQCILELRGVDMPAGVLGKSVQDEVQERDVLIAAMLLDGP